MNRYTFTHLPTNTTITICTSSLRDAWAILRYQYGREYAEKNFK